MRRLHNLLRAQELRGRSMYVYVKERISQLLSVLLYQTAYVHTLFNIQSYRYVRACGLRHAYR